MMAPLVLLLLPLLARLALVFLHLHNSLRHKMLLLYQEIADEDWPSVRHTGTPRTYRGMPGIVAYPCGDECLLHSRARDGCRANEGTHGTMGLIWLSSWTYLSFVVTSGFSFSFFVGDCTPQ